MALAVDGAWQMALGLFERTKGGTEGVDQIGYSTAIKACEAGELWQGLYQTECQLGVNVEEYCDVIVWGNNFWVFAEGNHETWFLAMSNVCMYV